MALLTPHRLRLVHAVGINFSCLLECCTFSLYFFNPISDKDTSDILRNLSLPVLLVNLNLLFIRQRLTQFFTKSSPSEFAMIDTSVA